MKLKPKKKFQGGQAESIVMRVTDYKLDEKGAAVALKGVTFPDKREVEVSLTDTGKAAENPNRNSLNDYRKGFNLGGIQYKLEPGGLVSFSRAYKRPDGGYQTPWMDVLAYNSEKAQQHISTGLSVVRVYTPRETKLLLKDAYEKLKAEGVPQDQLAREVEKQLPSGTQRFRGIVEMYHPSQSMRGTEADELRSAVETYFNAPQFKERVLEDGDSARAQADPGVIVRFLDQEDRVADFSYIPHFEFYQNDRMLTSEEQVDYVLDTIRQTQNANPELVAVDILPFSEFAISPKTLQVGKSGQKIESFRRAFEGGHPRTEDGEMETVAHPALVKFSTDGYFINAVAGDFKGEGVDPVLLAKDGQTLIPAPQLYAEPEEPEGPQAGQSPSTSEAAPAHPVDENIVPAPAGDAARDERTSEDEDGPAPGR